MEKIAIVYDFDKTLCTKDMQEYSLIPSLGYAKAMDFWQEVTHLSQNHHMDAISAYLFLLKEKFEKQGKPLMKASFEDIGNAIVFYQGVLEWFEQITHFGKSLDVEIEHYIISSGMKEIIEASKIAKYFKHIYACSYYYDENGHAKWPAQIVNYTTKTQYIFRINKQVLDENDDEKLNTYIDPKIRPIPLNRMIYIADGLTDVPCMRLVKEYGGKSIAVYDPSQPSRKSIAEKLIEEGRANFMATSNYQKDGQLDQIIKQIIRYMHEETVMKKMEPNHG